MRVNLDKVVSCHALLFPSGKWGATMLPDYLGLHRRLHSRTETTWDATRSVPPREAAVSEPAAYRTPAASVSPNGQLRRRPRQCCHRGQLPGALPCPPLPDPGPPRGDPGVRPGHLHRPGRAREGAPTHLCPRSGPRRPQPQPAARSAPRPGSSRLGARSCLRFGSAPAAAAARAVMTQAARGGDVAAGLLAPVVR